MNSSPLEHPQIFPQELQDCLKKFEAKANELFVRFDSEHQQPAPSILYHYTTDVGLYGMLENGSLWLNDVFSMNDPSELRHGILLALDVLKSKRPSEIAMYERCLGILLEELPGTAHYLACSFSEEKDDLGQWRAYADDGRGYSIGFDGKLLEQAFEVSATGLERVS